jgi:hypothetical protein
MLELQIAEKLASHATVGEERYCVISVAILTGARSQGQIPFGAFARRDGRVQSEREKTFAPVLTL